MNIQRGDDKQPRQGQQGADTGGAEILCKAGDCDQSGRIHAQPRILQADKRDKQPDADRNALFQRQRTLVRERTINTAPSTNTASSATCQLAP